MAVTTAWSCKFFGQNMPKKFEIQDGVETFAFCNYVSGMKGMDVKANLATYIKAWKEQGGHPVYDAKEDLWIIYNDKQAKALGVFQA